jgi:hypothetical protein
MVEAAAGELRPRPSASPLTGRTAAATRGPPDCAPLLLWLVLAIGLTIRRLKFCDRPLPVARPPRLLPDLCSSTRAPVSCSNSSLLALVLGRPAVPCACPHVATCARV